MGCSCNKNVTRTSSTTKRQVIRQRAMARGTRSTNQSTKVVRRMIERY